METGSRNLALLHCSCLHACLAVYSNISRRDLNTTCITINRGVWSHGRGTNQRRSEGHGGFLKQVFSKSCSKTTWEMVSTCEVLWSAPLNMSKVTGNRQEDRSSQCEATKRSVELSTAKVVGAHRDRYQRRWTATVRHLICVNFRHMGLDGSDRNGDRHRNTSLTAEVVWRQKTTKLCALSCLHTLACKA